MSDDTSEDTQLAASSKLRDRGVRVAYGTMAAAAVIAVAVGAWRLLAAVPVNDLSALLNLHGPALLGIPAAVGVATVLIGVIRAADGTLQFDILGLKAEGAAAAAILWVTAFLAIALSIRALW
jgi:hypothetical protein